MEAIRVALNEADFRDLVAGRVVTISGGRVVRGYIVEIILSDIGWDRMEVAITDAALKPRE
jgi:hypothetical protein